MEERRGEKWKSEEERNGRVKWKSEEERSGRVMRREKKWKREVEE